MRIISTYANIWQWIFIGASRVYGKYNVNFQLFPAHLHQQNASEPEIRSWKNILLIRLSSVDDRFPMHFWDWLLDQADRTLNILWPARIDLTLSAYNMIWETFYFNRTPMGPLECKIIVYENPVKRESWAFHRVPGFYIGPFINGYNTYKVYIPNTREEKSVNTVEFFRNQPKWPSCQQQTPSQSQMSIKESFWKTCTGDANRRSWWQSSCRFAAAGQYFCWK